MTIFNTIFRLLLVFSGLLMLLISTSSAQQLTNLQRGEVNAQLQSMTPEEIETKIKSLGMTREEAEQRAEENGIDLLTYLRGANDAATTSSKSGRLVTSGPMMDMPKIETPVIATDVHREIPTYLGLKYFGYDIFSATPSAFEPSAEGPIDPEYIIGPEDVLRVSVWGQVEQQNELEVDKEGRIFIPTAGPVVVSGLTVGEVTKTLTKQLSRSFQGLMSNPKTVWMDVTIAKVRPKRVFIMGEVFNPGGYTVNSYASVFSSLFAVGGPTVNGSLREVRLIRGNKVIARIDLYSYFTGADKNNDLRVQSNDIIFVPVRKNSLTIKGEIRRPGVYELLPGENLKKLLEFSGGQLATSYLERVHIDRIIPFKERLKKEIERQVTDINFRDIVLKNADYNLHDGDIVTVLPILDEVKNYVTISGAVYKPGKYQILPNMRLLDLIELADSLKPETYLIRGEITRINSDNTTRLSIPFSLRSVIDGDQSQNVELLPRDEILIHDIGISQILNEFIEVRGKVKNPGRYALTKNMTLIDALMKAGGYTEDASYLQAEIARLDINRRDDTLSYISFAALPPLHDSTRIREYSDLEKFRVSDYKLQHRDHIFIRSNPEFHPQQLVSISGEVQYPGDYALITYNDYVSDVIKRAGGVTAVGYLHGGTIFRNGERVNVDLEKIVSAPKSKGDIVLHDGDKISIPKKPNTIKISGEINNPGLLGYIQGDKLWDYIDRAGGITDSADFILVYFPTGNVERFHTGWFSGNTTIVDGASIVVTKIPAEIITMKDSKSVGQTITDIFAIAASMLTVLVLARQL